MEKQLKLYSTGYTDIRTYILAMSFILGNIIFPQMCHQISLGGPTWLPIYFFTLIGAYKYGMKVGILTALLSPITNSLLFGMPMMSSVLVITLKSILLAMFAGYAAAKFQKVSLLILSILVLSYQIVGAFVEVIVAKDFYVAFQDFRIGIPGMVVQVIGGWILLNFAMRR